MVGDFVRDKDAVTSTLLSCEIAALLKNDGHTMYSKLQEIHLKHGLFKEKLISLTKKGINGVREINKTMEEFRNNPPNKIDESIIVKTDDFQSSISTDNNKLKTTINLPKSNVLIFTTNDGTKVALRPSGTEPKIKFYISVNGKVDDTHNYITLEDKLENKINRVISELKIH
jgi:phosphomannomutase